MTKVIYDLKDIFGGMRRCLLGVDHSGSTIRYIVASSLNLFFNGNKDYVRLKFYCRCDNKTVFNFVIYILVLYA